MNLAHLYYFKKLVEVKNYSRAAEELFIAQPTLSLAASSLERELGCALLKKKRNSLELTESGEDFYEAVVAATNSLDNAVRIIKERVSAEYGSIRVGTVYSIQDKVWSEAIHAYHCSTRSRVQINWKQGTTEGLMKDLKNGSLDVIMAGILSKNDPEVESIPATSQSVVLLVNQRSPLAQQKEISLSELAGVPIVTYRNKKGPFAIEISSLLAKHQNLSVAYDYNDEITLASLVTADPNVVAIACHSWLIGAFTEVVPVKITEAPDNFHQFYISYKKHGRLPFVVEEFVEFMKRYDFQNTTQTEDEHSIIKGI